ncbi:MAG: hypothetical protein ACLFUI_05895 [Halanaerobiales bacterium]
MANRLKIKLKINNFYIPIPPVPLSFISGILKLALKYSRNSQDDINLNGEEIDRLISTLRDTEPFELVNIQADDQDEKVYIRIYTK